jgi:hypothetical protein
MMPMDDIRADSRSIVPATRSPLQQSIRDAWVEH